MPTKQVRITVESEDLIKAYAGKDSLSRGIERMHTMIKMQDQELAKLKETANNLQSKQHWTNTGPVAGSHDAKYWLQFKESVKEAITEMQQ